MGIFQSNRSSNFYVWIKPGFIVSLKLSEMQYLMEVKFKFNIMTAYA